jgi:uncharacterized protein YndB with AHSA1/START domain
MTAAIVVVCIILAALAVVLALAAMRPDDFRVQRAERIHAPPERIFAAINDFHRWSAWSPWERMDPAMKRSFSGADSGKGAVYAWEGNSKVGAGRMEILDSTSPSLIRIKLDFIKPFEGHNTAEFTLTPGGDATDLRWAMFGRSPFVAKVMGLFVSMDRMIGKDFEAGLANLKRLAEGGTASVPPAA